MSSNESSTRTSVERVVFDYEARTDDALNRVDQLDNATDDLAERIQRLSNTAIDIRGDISLDDSPLTQLDGLNSTTFTPAIDPDLDRSELNDLEAVDSDTYTPEVDVQETTEGDAVLDRLDEIRNLQVIDIALNVAGQGLDAVQGIISLIGATEAAADAVAARLGETLPDAETRINNIFSAIGGDKADIGQAFSTAGTLGFEGDDIDLAVQKALEFSQVWGTDVAENLRTAQLLISQGLVPDITTAFDLLTAGNQEGLNADGGLGGTLIEYAATIREAGLDGSEALGLIESGLAAGFDNADRVLDALREFGIRANDTGDAAAQGALDTLGIPSPDEVEAQGGEAGAAYLQGVITAISNAPVDQQRSLTVALFGTQAEDFGIETILNLQPVNEFFDEIEGRAEEASTVFNDNLGATVAEFFRAAQVSVEGFLNNSTFRQNLADFQDGLKGTLDALSSGESLPDAIEIGFKVEGFSDQVDRIQSAIGNFVIGLLEMIASVQEFLGKDSSGTRSEIARLATGQLAFDAQSLDPEQIGGAIQTALNRGVSEADVSAAIGTAIQEQLDSGDLAGARQLIESAQLASATLSVAGFGGAGAQTISVQQAADETRIEFEARLAAMRDAFIAQAGVGATASFELLPELDLAASAATIDEAVTQLTADFNDAFNEGDLTEAIGIAEQLGDPALIEQVQFIAGQLRGEFDTALAEGDVTAALDAASYLPDDEALAATAAANAATFTEAFNQALSTGDTSTAEAIATLLGDETLIAQVEEYRTKLDDVKAAFEGFTEAGGGVSTTVTGIATDLSTVSDSSQAMADALAEHTGDAAQSMTDLSDATADAVSGNSIVPDLESVAEAASTSLPMAGRYALLFAADLLKASATSTSTLNAWGIQIDLIAAKAASLTASLSSIPNSAGAAGGGGGSNVNVNLTNNNNTPAAVEASNASTDQYFRGY